MVNEFSFFDDQQEESEELVKLLKTGRFDTVKASEIYVYCKRCRRTHRWLECEKRQIN